MLSICTHSQKKCNTFSTQNHRNRVAHVKTRFASLADGALTKTRCSALWQLNGVPRATFSIAVESAVVIAARLLSYASQARKVQRGGDAADKKHFSNSSRAAGRASRRALAARAIKTQSAGAAQRVARLADD